MEYINEDLIDINLKCGICNRPFKDAVCTPCDHAFGRECIMYRLLNTSENSCPVCEKKPLSADDLVPASRPLRSMIDQLRIRCTLCGHADLRCSDFNNHINHFCPKALVDCAAADIKCPWKGIRSELETHRSQCNFEPLRPILRFFIDENRRLNDQVSILEIKISSIIQEMSKLNNSTLINDENNDDNSSLGGSSTVDSTSTVTSNSIFIQNLPTYIKNEDIHRVFSQAGRILYNDKFKKPEIYIYEKLNEQQDRCNAKVTYLTEESATTAVTNFNNKDMPEWNTRLKVTIYQSRKKHNFNKKTLSAIGATKHEKVADANDITSNLDAKTKPTDQNKSAAKQSIASKAKNERN